MMNDTKLDQLMRFTSNHMPRGRVELPADMLFDIILELIKHRRTKKQEGD